jgi:hypothetical protein
MRLKLVVAGNYREYNDWIKRNHLSPQEYQYIGDLRQVRGLRQAKIYLVGNYHRSSLYNDLSCWSLIKKENEIKIVGDYLADCEKEIPKSRKKVC